MEWNGMEWNGMEWNGMGQQWRGDGMAEMISLGHRRSTIKKIKKECLHEARLLGYVECLLSVAGDLTDASVGQLPRDKKQETNMRREAEGVMWAEFRTPKTPQAPYNMCIKYQE